MAESAWERFDAPEVPPVNPPRHTAGVVSITITLFNKAVFSIFNFKFPMVLFVAQV